MRQQEKMDCFVASLLAMTTIRYLKEIKVTTLIATGWRNATYCNLRQLGCF